MAKIFIYKTAGNKILTCTPVDKSDMQKDLSILGKERYIVNAAANVVAWANNVVDFNNITDDEYKARIVCDIPSDNLYCYWLDNPSDFFRDAWSDIDASGAVTYDLTKAKGILIDKLAGKYKENRGKMQGLLDLGYTGGYASVDAINAKQVILQDEIARIRALTVTNVSDLTPSVALLGD